MFSIIYIKLNLGFLTLCTLSLNYQESLKDSERQAAWLLARAWFGTLTQLDLHIAPPHWLSDPVK